MPPDPSEVLRRPAPAPDRTVRHGRRADQVYEVYLPRAPETGVCVVLVHGGFWRAEYDRTHVRPLAVALAREGHTVAVPEYRRTGMPGGTWPGPGEDVAAALAAVRSDPALPSTVVLMGHSAGAHLAVWALHRAEAAGVAGAVSLAGCLDLVLVARLGLGHGAAAQLLGTTPQERPELYAAADPVQLGPTPVPVLLVHGVDDVTVPPQVSRSWVDRVGTTGRDLLTTVRDCEHFGLIDPAHHGYATVAAQVLALTTAREDQ